MTNERKEFHPNNKFVKSCWPSGLRKLKMAKNETMKEALRLQQEKDKSGSCLYHLRSYKKKRAHRIFASRLKVEACRGCSSLCSRYWF